MASKGHRDRQLVVDKDIYMDKDFREELKALQEFMDYRS